MTETPNQLVERLRKKYAHVLEAMESDGLNDDQEFFDRFIEKLLGEPKKAKPRLMKLNEILKKY